MARLKSWESPRRQGRNDKGKGGSARARQLKKREKMLRQKLKNTPEGNSGGRESSLPLFVWLSRTRSRTTPVDSDRGVNL